MGYPVGYPTMTYPAGQPWILFTPHSVSHGVVIPWIFPRVFYGTPREILRVGYATGFFSRAIPSWDIPCVLFIPCGIPWGSHGTPVGPAVAFPHGVSPIEHPVG